MRIDGRLLILLSLVVSQTRVTSNDRHTLQTLGYTPMIRLFDTLFRFIGRLVLISLVVVGLIATAGFVGVGPLADELSETNPSSDVSVDGLSNPLAGSPADPANESDGNSSIEQNASAVDEAETERLVHEAINDERTAEELDTLERDRDLRAVARGHSADMIEQGYVGHDSPDGLTPADRLAEAGCSAGGENVAQSWVGEPVDVDGERFIADDEAELADHLVERWMDSPGHRENVLRESFAESGVGVVVTDDNRVYATQKFCAESATSGISLPLR